MKTLNIVFNILLVGKLLVAVAYTQQLPSINYTTRHGLTQMQCMSVLKDNRGYIWVGTKFGLSKFDGERFESFTQADGMLHSYSQNLTEDPQGYIWIDNVIGLTRFDGKTFTQFPLPDKQMQIANQSWINDQGQPVVSVTDGQKKQLLKLQNGKYIHIPGSEIKHAEGEVLFYDRQHDRYCLQTNQKDGTKTQLWYLENGRRIHWLDTDNFIQRDGNATLADGTPMLYSPSASNGALITYFTIEGDSIRPFFRTDGQTATVLRPLAAAALVTHGSNHYLLEANATQLTALPLPPTQLSQSIFDAGGLWCATEKGLFRIWNNGFRYFSEAEVPYCWSVVEDRNNHLWFLSYRSPILKWNGQHLSRINGYQQLLYNRNNTQPDNWYYHPVRDKYGHLWLPNIKGALRYDGKQFTLITDPKQVTTLCLLEDPERNLILKGGQNQVLFIDNKAPFRYTRFDQSNGFKDPNELILAIEKDSRGFYWFGGRDLTRYDYHRKKATYYTIENGKFPAKGVYSMCLDNRHTLWIASRKGLLRYDARQDRFRMVLSDSLISSALLVGQFDKDNLLVGDMKNLYVVDLAQYYRTGKVVYKAFNHHNGFMGLEPGQNGYYKDSRGYIWITSGSVLSRLDSRQINLNPTPLRLFITKVGMQRIPFVGKLQEVALPDGENTVSFTVETLGDDKPFMAQYSYKVDGFLNEWSPWQSQNLIALTNLPAGAHTLRVRTRSGNQINEVSAEASLTFRVSIPFWRSPNFYKYAFFMGLLLISGIGYFWWLQERERRKVKLQERQLEEKEHKVRFLQVQTIQVQMNPHFTFNVLGTIQHLILNNDINQASVNLLKLGHLIRNYLEASLLGDEENGSLFNHEIPLTRELDLLRMYIEFEQLQYEDRFDFEITIDGKINPDNYRIPPLIIQPYIENAIKHGLLNRDTPGHLWIGFISLDDDTLICTIEDDGIGRVQAAKLQRESLRKFKSRGTELVKRRVEILNQMGYAIRIQESDRIGSGTVITIQIGYH